MNGQVPQIRLRRATAADAPLLRRWDDEPHVISARGADGGSDFNWEYELTRAVAWRELLIGELNGCPVGIYVYRLDNYMDESRAPCGPKDDNMNSGDVTKR